MLVWLLDLDIGGRMLHLSSNPVEFDGKLYKGTLDSVTLTESLDDIGTIPADRTANVTAILDANLGKLVNEGHDFTAGSATLQLWHTDEPEYMAQAYMYKASVANPQVGDEFETVNLNLTLNILDDTANMVDIETLVSDDNLTDATGRVSAPSFDPFTATAYAFWNDDRTDLGNYYPIPYVVGDLLVPMYQAAPCAFDSDGKVVGLIIAGRRTGSAIARVYTESVTRPGELRVIDGPGSTPQDYTIIDKIDNEGRLVQCIYFAELSGSTSDFRVDETFYVSLDGFGVKGASVSGPIDTVGKLICELCSRSSLPFNMASVKAAVYDLPGTICWFVDEEITPAEMLEDILANLPLSLFTGPDGIEIIRLDMDPLPDRCIELVEGLNCWRDGLITLARRPEDAASKIVVEYSPVLEGDGFARSIVLDQRPSPGQNRYATPWTMTTSSPEATNGVELVWTKDQRAAMYVASWVSRKTAYTARTVNVQVNQKLARVLRPGTAIKFTDASISMADVVGVVSSRTASDADLWTLELSFYPTTSSRATEQPFGASPIAPSVAEDAGEVIPPQPPPRERP